MIIVILLVDIFPQTMAVQLDKWVKTAEKARLPTRNHEKALHEILLAMFALLHVRPCSGALQSSNMTLFMTNSSPS